jgi:hypothetical protein
LPAKLPFTTEFACDEPAVLPWQFAVQEASQPTAIISQWKVDTTALEAGTPATACSLNLNNGKQLACGEGQSVIHATATSPWIDATYLAPGTVVLLAFESAGTWTGAAVEAAVEASLDGKLWSLLAKAPPSPSGPRHRST